MTRDPQNPTHLVCQDIDVYDLEGYLAHNGVNTGVTF